MKKQDFKRQLAAIMALAVTFSSVPPVWADEISFITDDDITLNSISTIGMETNAYDLLSDPVSDCPFIITGSADSAVPLEHYYALGSEAVGSQKLVFYVNSNGAEDFKITSVTYNEADATSKLYGLIKLEEVNGVSKYAYAVHWNRKVTYAPYYFRAGGNIALILVGKAHLYKFVFVDNSADVISCSAERYRYSAVRIYFGYQIRCCGSKSKAL